MDSTVDQTRVNKVLSLLSEKKGGNSNNSTPKASRGTTRTRVSLSPTDSIPLHQCRPWSRSDFSLRVCTFSPAMWFGKPVQVSPLVCARFGWFNTKPDTIECGVCKSHLIFEIADDLEGEGLAKAVVEFRSCLETGHEPGCPWLSKQCPTSFASFPEPTQASLIGDLLDRVESILPFKSIGSTLVSRNDGNPYNIDDVSDEQLYEALKTHITDKSSPILAVGAEHCVAALKIALYGWDVGIVDDCPRKRVKLGPSGQAVEELVYFCSLCHRRVLTGGVSDDSTPSAHQFDPAGDHRSYCPWVIAVPEPAQDDPGWKLCLDALLLNNKTDSISTGTVTRRTSADGVSLVSNGDALAFVRQQLDLDTARERLDT